MPQTHVSPRMFSLRRPLTLALLLGLAPLGTAFAQANQALPFVRVTRDKTEISSLRATRDVRMTAPKGAVLEVIYIEGDRYRHLDSNWYWVLLPRDPWATRPAGWIRGDAIEHIATAAAGPSPLASNVDTPPAEAARTEARSASRIEEAPVRAAVEDTPVSQQVYSDVVLNFQFGRSELTEEAKRKLADAMVRQSRAPGCPSRSRATPTGSAPRATTSDSGWTARKRSGATSPTSSAFRPDRSASSATARTARRLQTRREKVAPTTAGWSSRSAPSARSVRRRRGRRRSGPWPPSGPLPCPSPGAFRGLPARGR